MSNEVTPIGIAIPLLAQEWAYNWEATASKFQAFIRYYEYVKQPLAALVYRCALVQLKYGQGVDVIDGMGFDDNRLRSEAGA